MRAEIDSTVQDIRESLALLRQRMNWDAGEARLAELDAQSEDPALWDDPQAAQKMMRERQTLRDSFDLFNRLEGELGDHLDLMDLARGEGDSGVVSEAESAIIALQARAQKSAIAALLNGEADGNDSFLEINSGAGGTESCDWAAILARMYIRWAERAGYKVELVAETSGDEAGIKSATYQIKGVNAYGWLKTESGVHRLVRISPFDSNARRHTSFSSVWVYPVIDDAIEIDISPADLRVDTFRASGAGGQHVNKTDSAVRMTHVPTGIVVQASAKSQHQNRASCLAALKSRLYDIEMKSRNESIQEAHENKGDAGWGHQIRSYVLAPYQMVKDLRTQVETSDTQGVLDGDLDRFMAAALAGDVTGKSRAEVRNND